MEARRTPPAAVGAQVARLEEGKGELDAGGAAERGQAANLQRVGWAGRGVSEGPRKGLPAQQRSLSARARPRDWGMPAGAPMLPGTDLALGNLDGVGAVEGG